MNEQRFGPWSSALGDGLSPRLSTFWKRRLARLAPARSSRLELSRRDCLRLGAAGAAACALPTLHLASTAAPATANRIYLFKSGTGGGDTGMGLFAIDPETATWNMVCDFEEGGGVRLSPDRRTLALCRATNSPHGAGVWTIGSDGKGARRRVADFSGFASWSPDGTQLIIAKSLTTRVDQDTKTENWRFNADGSGATKLPIPETDWVVDWSPDGRWLATVSDRHPPHHQGYQVYIMRPDGTEQRRMTEGGLNLFARFSPDGRRIAYLHVEGGEHGIWVVGVDGGGRRRVIGREIGLSASRLCWSPDGKSLAYTIKDLQQDEQEQWSIKSFKLAIIDAEGKGHRTLKLPPAKFLGDPDDWR